MARDHQRDMQARQERELREQAAAEKHLDRVRGPARSKEEAQERREMAAKRHEATLKAHREQAKRLAEQERDRREQERLAKDHADRLRQQNKKR